MGCVFHVNGSGAILKERRFADVRVKLHNYLGMQNQSACMIPGEGRLGAHSCTGPWGIDFSTPSRLSRRTRTFGPTPPPPQRTAAVGGGGRAGPFLSTPGGEGVQSPVDKKAADWRNPPQKSPRKKGQGLCLWPGEVGSYSFPGGVVKKDRTPDSRQTGK